MKTKLVVFDIAGTTLQDNGNVIGTAFLKAIKDHGYSIQDDDINWIMGYKKREAIRMLLEKEEINIDNATINSIHDQFIRELNTYYKKADIKEVDGISDLFRRLKENGIKVALNTGFNRSTTDIIIDRIGWVDNDLIDDSIASDEVENGRPDSDMIQELSKRFGILSAAYITKVGDTPSDLFEGINANCGKTIGVLYGTHSREELEKYPHDYLAEDVKDLTKAIFSNDSQ